MDSKIVKSISAQIHRQFPQVAGVQPKIRLQPIPAKSARSSGRVYLLTYHAKVSDPSGRDFPHWVRVTSDPQGHILKISTSR